VPSISSLAFDNSYARLSPEFYEVVDPTPLPGLSLVAFNPDAAQLIDLDAAVTTSSDLASYLSGARRVPGAEPVAMLYAGHQFGVWVPQLGDGRAFLLGEVKNRRGDRWDLHLKGWRADAVSRAAVTDGRSCEVPFASTWAPRRCTASASPTTRALAIVASEALVRREMPSAPQPCSASRRRTSASAPSRRWPRCSDPTW
jgi:uncharacterized protein YdiU (UPF0061 family)